MSGEQDPRKRLELLDKAREEATKGVFAQVPLDAGTFTARLPMPGAGQLGVFLVGVGQGAVGVVSSCFLPAGMTVDPSQEELAQIGAAVVATARFTAEASAQVAARAAAAPRN